MTHSIERSKLPHVIKKSLLASSCLTPEKGGVQIRIKSLENLAHFYKKRGRSGMLNSVRDLMPRDLDEIEIYLMEVSLYSTGE